MFGRDRWRQDSGYINGGTPYFLDKTDGDETPDRTVEARLLEFWTRPMEVRLQMEQRRRDSGFLDDTDGGKTPGRTVEARLRGVLGETDGGEPQ